MALKIRPVISKKLAGEVYDPEEFVLYIMFPNGGTYCYGDEQNPFPPELHAEFLQAPSKGIFFNERIKGPDRNHPLFPFHRIGDKTTFFKVGDEIPFKEKSLFINDDDLPKSMFDPAPKREPKASHTIIDQKLRMDSVVRNGEIVDNDPLGVGQDDSKCEMSTTVIATLPEDPQALVKHAQSVKQQVEGLTRMDGVRVALVVTDAKGYESAVNLLVKLKAEQKLAQLAVDKVKRPAYDAYQAQLAWEKEVINPYKVAIEQLLDPACTKWRQDQQEAERQREREARLAEQQRLDEQARVDAAEAKRIADSQAVALEAAGQHEIAKEVREAPVMIAPREAAPVVMQTAVPKVQGARVSGTWKYRIVDPLRIPIALTPQLAQAMADHGYGPLATAKSIDLLAMALGKMFAEFYTLDESKVGAKTKLKEAAVGSIPGVDFYFNEKTGASGR